MTNHTPLTDQELAYLQAIADRSATDPFYVSDCEGSLQVWREKALTHVRRDADSAIEMYSFPSSYKVTDQILELDLDTWDPGEDATDDQRRQDINDLVDARAAVGALLEENRRLRARRLTEGEYNAAWHAVEGAAGEEGADPGTVLHAVLDRLGISWRDAAAPQPRGA
jgi:hypothetical protein